MDGGVSPLTALAASYGCPEAPEPLAVDGGFLYAPKRVQRLNCLLLGTSAELFALRDAADAGTLAPSLQSNTAHVVISTTAALLSAWTAYAQSRNARGLKLWPP